MKITKFMAILCVHDVTPKFKKEITYIDNMLDTLNVKRTYAVIPLYLNLKENDLRRNLDFVNYLKSKSHEVVLHGLTHTQLYIKKASFSVIIMKQTIGLEKVCIF